MFKHISVLKDESIEGLKIIENGIYIDCTMGGAGHSIEIAKKLKNGRLICIDQDINSIKKGEEVLEKFKDKITIVRDNFSNIKYILDNLGINKCDGFLLDLGISSHQIDDENRGFSYMRNAKLDMRMDNRNNISAYEIINNYSEENLLKLFFNYGEEKFSKRIVKNITDKRKIKKIETTLELSEIIINSVPKSKIVRGSHPAKRVFQALRIEVNNELEILNKSLSQMIDFLNPNGRICVITFHSLEDRIVKQCFKTFLNICTCPRDFPICVCNKKAKINILTKKPINSTQIEIDNNSRAKSAKLRIIEKI